MVSPLPILYEIDRKPCQGVRSFSFMDFFGIFKAEPDRCQNDTPINNKASPELIAVSSGLAFLAFKWR